MTSKSFSKKIRTRVSLVLAVLSILCFTLFSVACSKTTTTVVPSDPTYTYSETDDGIISNPTFAFGTADTKLENYPKTSPTGWSRSKDTTGASSSAKSGVINVSEAGWAELMKALYKDSYFLGFIKNKYDIDDNAVKTAIKNGDENKTVSDDEIRDYIIKEYFKNFENPSKSPNATDNYVYMLNNYRSKNDYGLGSSQKITSSKSIAIDKGEYVKISVNVKTAFLTGVMNADENFGANIRLTNTFNGSTQKEFVIKNIKNTDWQEYTIYVKGDDIYNSTVTIALGLGYGEKEQTEGTVFFDDVMVEKIDEDTFKDSTTSINTTRNLLYSGSDIIAIDAENENGAYLYDMSLTNSLTDDYVGANYSKILTGDFTDDYYTKTETTTEISGNRFQGESSATLTGGSESIVYGKTVATNIVEINKASYTLELDVNDASFTVGAEEFVLVSFFVKNELSKLSNTSITIDLFDKYDGETVKRAAVATLSEANGEWTKCSILVKNNFKNSTDVRSFYLEIVIGPTNVASTEMAKDYASGKVSISQPVVISGKTYNEAEKEGNTLTDEQKLIAEHQYKLYKLYESTASGSSALHAGYSNDYTEQPDDGDNESFAINPSKSELGAIETRPVAPEGYKGIVPNHIYLKEDGENITSEINGRLTGDNGNYAGLINTKGNYTGFDAKTALGFNSGDKNLQPIMIYNATANHYGFIGNSNTISANAYAKVSVSVKVDATAKAYIYLVDVSGKTKNVMEFVDFTVNTNGTDEVKDGKTYKAEDNKLFFEVGNTAGKGDNGWVTVTFYVAAGATAKNFRVEIWNGGRDGLDATKSQGYVFCSNISVTTSSAFSEPTTFNSAYTSGNPLGDMGIEALDNSTKLLYQRQLTDLEKKFNEEKADSTNVVAYEPKYVWVQNDTVIYAIFNSIDIVENDPYASLPTEEETTEEGATATTDPATFWLSFSSILLGAVLALAIVALVIKNVRRRRKANASDAKSHYTVTSRVRSKKYIANNKTEEVDDAEETIDENVENATDEEVENETDKLGEDSYVYGDVQDFGDDQKKD